MQKKSLEFKEMLVRRTGLDVVMWDERLTTVEAERTLIESQVRRENRKQYIDKIAAVFYPAGISGFDLFEKRKPKRKTRSCPQEEERMEKIKFCFDESGDSVEFFVLEQTKINGASYILVTDSQEDDAECLILKEGESQDAKESVYEIVEDDVELQAVSKVFEELLEDVEIEM